MLIFGATTIETRQKLGRLVSSAAPGGWKVPPVTDCGVMLRVSVRFNVAKVRARDWARLGLLVLPERDRWRDRQARHEYARTRETEKDLLA